MIRLREIRQFKINKIVTIIIILILSIGSFLIIQKLIMNFSEPDKKWFANIEHADSTSNNYFLDRTTLEFYFSQLGSHPYYHSTEFEMPKDKNVYRVFILGEASLSGWPYSTNQSVREKVNTILDKFFNEKNVEIISTSIAGFNSSLALSFIEEIVKYEPDLIVLYLGHNEFYGYNGSSNFLSLQEPHLFKYLKGIFHHNNLSDSFSYDYSVDDLETILPLATEDFLIKKDSDAYASVCSQFEDNIESISELCSAANIKLVLPILPDNLLIPPIPIGNLTDNYNADLIFNNARMALFRDGNKGKAVELFRKTRDIDVIRLRIPSDIRTAIKKFAAKDEVIIANLDSLFSLNSKNYIPGEDLFVDHIHPNLAGLNIIASEFSRIILNNVTNKENQNQLRSILSKLNSQCQLSHNDSTLAEKRIKLAKEKILKFTKKNRLRFWKMDQLILLNLKIILIVKIKFYQILFDRFYNYG